MGVQITVLGSGSGGNATLIESPTVKILVDAGLSGRQIAHRLESMQRRIEQIDAVLLTHEHSDHMRALGVLCKGRPLAVYANRLTAEAVSADPEWKSRVQISWRVFSTGQPFEIGDLTVESFSIPHDAHDPVGFFIRHAATGVGVGLLTDLGHATKLVIERVRHANALVLESNHDVKLLQDDTARPWATKQRIMSRHGHLSNDAAASLAAEIAGDQLQHLVLAHLSRDCNRPDLARRVVTDKLRQAGAGHVTVSVSTQDQPTATLGL